VALFHDVLITLGVFSVLNLEISLPIIAALLTIVGYSLNDTIVVFDRIRENLSGKVGKLSFEDRVNSSINQCLSRTVITSLTTLIVVAVIYAFFFGSRDVIEYFSMALIAGVMVGTYSSVFVASPVLVMWNKKWPIK
jgi:preprotein translocase subunit SecF